MSDEANKKLARSHSFSVRKFVRNWITLWGHFGSFLTLILSNCASTISLNVHLVFTPHLNFRLKLAFSHIQKAMLFTSVHNNIVLSSVDAIHCTVTYVNTSQPYVNVHEIQLFAKVSILFSPQNIQ